MQDLGDRFDQAVSTARKLHRTQLRKGTSAPYLCHLLAVASLVLEHGGDEDEAIAALLHDGPEDCRGEETLTEIREAFGERVAAIVAHCSDTMVQPKPPWRARKERYLASLETADSSTLLVSLADKVHNARSLLVDYRTRGPDLWRRFYAPAKFPDLDATRDAQLWVYGELAGTFRAAAGRHPRLESLASELGRVVHELRLSVEEREGLMPPDLRPL